jgi:hypothetical protein
LGLGALLRKGVALADKITGGSDGVQDDVTLYPWTGTGTYGEPTYGAGVPISAFIEDRMVTRNEAGGDEISSRTVLTIMRPITPNGATGRREPLDTRDKIVLPDGSTGPILAVNGPNDPTTHAPFVYEVILG